MSVKTNVVLFTTALVKRARSVYTYRSWEIRKFTISECARNNTTRGRVHAAQRRLNARCTRDFYRTLRPRDHSIIRLFETPLQWNSAGRLRMRRWRRRVTVKINTAWNNEFHRINRTKHSSSGPETRARSKGGERTDLFRPQTRLKRSNFSFFFFLFVYRHRFGGGGLEIKYIII